MTDIDHLYSLIPIDILKKTKILTQLNHFWHEIGGDSAQHSQVANYEQGLLTLITRSSAWATRIRFSEPDLIKQLTLHPEFKDVRKIQCKLRSTPNKDTLEDNLSESAPIPLSVSEETIKLIRQIAETIKNEKLKNSLLKLCSGN